MKTDGIIKPQTITLTSECKHKNGWYKTIYFDWFVFNFKKPCFVCIDCHDVIEVSKYWNLPNQSPANNASTDADSKP